MALGKVYTFGPTFRAENSNTSRHLAEFWMIEPEVAFNDLTDNMDLAEDCLRFVLTKVLERFPAELEFLAKREADIEKQLPADQRNEMGLIERLRFVTENPFVRITYTEAIDLLRNSKPFKKKKFKYPVEWGIDLQSEHERWLVEKKFKQPVILTDYPAEIKAFYMRANEDGKTVAAMDVLVPGIGELVGGSQREERLDVLKKKCADFDIPEDHVWWYLDTRRFGTAPHAGFGMGFERLVMFATGMTNIRDVIPFPRDPTERGVLSVKRWRRRINFQHAQAKSPAETPAEAEPPADSADEAAAGAHAGVGGAHQGGDGGQPGIGRGAGRTR